MKLNLILLSLLMICANAVWSQQLVKGTIIDEFDSPIPYAKIYVKNGADLRTEADVNGYYEMRLGAGEYFLVFAAMGFDSRESYLTVSDKPVEKNMQLFPAALDIEGVEVSAKKSNPGREIMLKVVAKRDKINQWNHPHTVQGYIRATENIDRNEKNSKEKKKNSKEKKKKNKEKKEEPENTDPDGVKDPFAAEKAERERELTKLANSMNLVESNFTLHYGDRNHVKEIRNAYEQRGQKRRNHLYYTTTVKSNFNFFKNLLHLDDLHQTPVSSPISGPGILSYKYRLVDQYEENGQKIHKIKIIPRYSSTSTLAGHIYVIDSLWLIQKIDLTMEKGNLLVYDYFQIEQQFEHPGDTLCLLTKQTLTYGVKYKTQTSKCTTIATFKDYNFSPNFGSKFFSNEVAVTEQEAYDKDTTYWAENRSTELTLAERRYIITKDSIHDAHNRVEYLDSVDAVFNKITVWKVLWFGIEHRNRSKKTQWYLSSLASLIEPISIGGPRINPGYFYFKKWENEQILTTSLDMSVGILNTDLRGSTSIFYRYQPFHFGSVRTRFYHSLGAIRNADAFTQIYKRDNFFEVTGLYIEHDYELFNGFYVNNEFNFAERRSIQNYKFLESLDEFLPNNDPTEFEAYQAFIANMTIRYIPNQKYMREPNRKVILGSKWPTFYVYYEKGIPTLFGSDIDYDYVSGGIRQTFKIGTLGTSSYHVKGGTFLTTNVVKEIDRKFQRRSDPIFFTNPLGSFQSLDSLLPTDRFYLEGHYIHHDNGAIINKIPFMKKTRIGLVGGASYLYVPEHNWQHYEFVFGLERTFKFSRRRLRLGIYGTYADGNQMDSRFGWKISFDLLSDRDMKYNF
ncbi:MAG: carboxypeptidase-like regulatory domain-containing protein [Crocinitomicaceae bacterium]|nr:DUF5686 and carboxypeptidase regulatory-like domain-containing protein [Flavobacteriales bacterium]NQZ35972.1 carboxypeptidase-like regulatory domain-containing protein [Crocinitomicaceae bacterium]